MALIVLLSEVLHSRSSFEESKNHGVLHKFRLSFDKRYENSMRFISGTGCRYQNLSVKIEALKSRMGHPQY